MGSYNFSPALTKRCGAHNDVALVSVSPLKLPIFFGFIFQ